MSVPKAAALSPEEITRRSKSNFLLSFAFLEPHRRRGLSAVYAWCRAVDDAVDDSENPEQGQRQLEFWREEFARVSSGSPQTQTGAALQRTVREFGVDPAHLREILDGVAMDLEGTAFADLAELEAYCHKVASAVGLACLPVFGASGAGAERYAQRLGLALQLTNILRDLRSDALEGRVYAPTDHLARAEVDVAWLRGSGPPEAYADGAPVARLVEALAAVARERFAEAALALPAESRRALLPAEIMGAIYFDLLRRVERRGGRIDRGGRLRVPRWRKLSLALRTWWRGRR